MALDKMQALFFKKSKFFSLLCFLTDKTKQYKENRRKRGGGRTQGLSSDFAGRPFKRL